MSLQRLKSYFKVAAIVAVNGCCKYRTSICRVVGVARCLQRRKVTPHSASRNCTIHRSHKPDAQRGCLVHERHQDAKQHLQQLLELLKDRAADDPKGSSLSVTVGSPPPENYGAQAVAMGNLGLVCRELGDAEGASRLMEASLDSALSAACASAR